MLFLAIILFLQLYILARMSLFYMSFWAVALLLATIVMLSCSSGRQRVEKELKRRLAADSQAKK